MRCVISDLRRVVLSLREPRPDFAELLRLLESRSRELCGDAKFHLDITGVLTGSELGAFQESVLPVCHELVRNAASHGAARQISVAVDICSQQVEIHVHDDGRGLSSETWSSSRGGLHIVRRRVEQLGGSIGLDAADRGTHFAIVLPRPLRFDGGRNVPRLPSTEVEATAP